MSLLSNRVVNRNCWSGYLTMLLVSFHLSVQGIGDVVPWERKKVRERESGRRQSFRSKTLLNALMSESRETRALYCSA